MILNDETIALIRRFEGSRLKPYDDGAGYRTIGIGHRILPDERFDTITEAKAEELLRKDLEAAQYLISRYVKVPLNANQYGALTSLCFNCGSAPLLGTLGLRLNARQYDKAAEQFDRWIFAGGKVMNGLKIRRAAERTLFEKAV